MTSTNWNTITTGLSDAVGTLIPVSGSDVNEISVVSFGSSADTYTPISNYLVTDATARTNLAAQIAALPYLNSGATNFASAFDAMSAALLASTAVDISDTYVNFSTDGQQNEGGTGQTEFGNMITNAGVDNVSVEGIGSGVDAADLQTNFCYPTPCDTAAPYNFPTQGFYIGIASADEYGAAIREKIATITSVPLPGTLALLSLGILGVGYQRRRHAKAA